ncbi:FAD-dependent oxidoreductase [Halobacteriales archaeon Cl-PHB]
MGYTPHVLIVGGGAVGTGVARDLAMRGLEVTLVERGSLASGASGHMHTLLHSGARYADDDPETAAACYRENRILKRTARSCIADVGGLFLRLSADDEAYFDRKVEACEAADIPVETLTGDEARERDPTVADAVDAAIAVPDGIIDPVRLCLANARSAADHGATIRTNTDVVDVVVEDGAVSGVRVSESDLAATFTPHQVETIEADYVVNVAGAHVARVAAMADLEVPVRHSQGAMLSVDFPEQETVVNRCRPRTEGDIAVPFGGASILGTTDRDVAGPEDVDETAEEIDTVVEELSAVLPDVVDARPLRAYWGLRALVDENAEDSTEVSREFLLLDHEQRDGRWGMASVVGGKLTTHRLVAERVADHVCGAFGIDRACQTDEVPLPGSGSDGMHAAMRQVGQMVDASPGRRAMAGAGPADRSERAPSPVVCECESVTRNELDDEAGVPGVAMTPDLHAVRGATQASLGACQGGRCAHRIANWLHPEYDELTVSAALEDLFETCWDQQRHALWGDQLGEAAATYALHRTTMNRDGPIVADVDWEAFDDGPEDDSDDGHDWDPEKYEFGNPEDDGDEASQERGGSQGGETDA